MSESQESFQVGAPPAAPTKRSRTGLIVVLVLMGAVLATMVGLGVLWLLFGRDTPLEAAKATCAPGSAFARIGDGGDTLTLQTVGKEATGLSLDELRCFIAELEVSDAVQAELNSTRALDGKQTAEWGDLRASWTYHPDSGLRMVVTMR